MKLTQEQIKAIADRITQPLVIFDLETTGIDKTRDEVVQFYGFRIEPDGEHYAMEFKCKPTIPISKEASEVHGITNEDLENEEPFRHYIPDLLALFDGCMIGGYNVFNFDLPIINRQFAEHGEIGVFKEAHVLDSFKLAMIQHPRDLSSMLKVYTGEDMENAHDAGADVHATGKILVKQLEKDEDEVLIIAEKTAPPPNERVGLTNSIIFVDGEPVFNFGKHKGEKVIEQMSYCSWILGQADFDVDVKDFIRNLIR